MSDKITMTESEFEEIFCTSMAKIGSQAAGKALDLFADMLDDSKITGATPAEQLLMRKTVQKIAKQARELAERYRSGALKELTPESFRALKDELGGG